MPFEGSIRCLVWFFQDAQEQDRKPDSVRLQYDDADAAMMDTSRRMEVDEVEEYVPMTSYEASRSQLRATVATSRKPVAVRLSKPKPTPEPKGFKVYLLQLSPTVTDEDVKVMLYHRHRTACRAVDRRGRLGLRPKPRGGFAARM